MKSLPDSPAAAEENPVALLEELSVVKSHYKTLCMRLEKISVEQRESMKSIRAALENTTKLVQALQQHADLEWEECHWKRLHMQTLRRLLEDRLPGEVFARAALSISQMNKMNVKATDLKELPLAELDKQGNVK
ncbi:PREDICTED: spindle and kinetochore-associated protein 2 [Apaloderma vittatum]|uniref:spindle and kinetochore-associated protein 2 n=1 Tax=Apaloderma vittatum TaxID=57397 RepID=UPI000521AC99|nr:PREDICTED: spindle and kinetochore-associated protein 2 [Apaloderma vittatum]